MAEAWWQKSPEEMTREELVARLETVNTVNGLLKNELKRLIAENAALTVAREPRGVAAT